MALEKAESASAGGKNIAPSSFGLSQIQSRLSLKSVRRDRAGLVSITAYRMARAWKSRAGLQNPSTLIVENFRPENEYYILEVNPLGQWLWLERLADVPISQAVSDALVICSTYKFSTVEVSNIFLNHVHIIHEFSICDRLFLEINFF